jgi:hypothetical protein
LKSYKREVAAISLAALYIFIGYTLHTLAQLNQTAAMVDLVGVLVIPTFATVAAAFGIDSYFKQNPATRKDDESNK